MRKDYCYALGFETAALFLEKFLCGAVKKDLGNFDPGHNLKVSGEAWWSATQTGPATMDTHNGSMLAHQHQLGSLGARRAEQGAWP